MMIEVFGPGCARCERTLALVEKVVEESGRDDIGVTKITSQEILAARGVMMTPAVAVDGVLRCQGRIPSEDEVRSWLQG